MHRAGSDPMKTDPEKLLIRLGILAASIVISLIASHDFWLLFTPPPSEGFILIVVPRPDQALPVLTVFAALFFGSIPIATGKLPKQQRQRRVVAVGVVIFLLGGFYTLLLLLEGLLFSKAPSTLGYPILVLTLGLGHAFALPEIIVGRQAPKRSKRDKREAESRATPQEEKDPDIHFNVTQLQSNGEKRTLPSVGFNLENRSGRQVRLRVVADVFLDGKYLGNPSADSGHYSGKRIWNLNANWGIKDGNFAVPVTKVERDQRLMIRVTVAIIDEQERERKLLPLGWVYMRENNDWFFEPGV